MGTDDGPAAAGCRDARRDFAQEREVDGGGVAAGSVEFFGVTNSGEYTAAGESAGAGGFVCLIDWQEGERGDRGRSAAGRAERGRALHHQHRGDSKEGGGAL